MARLVVIILKCGGRRDRGLVGSLFWRWDVQVYAGSAVADYGVRRFDSTFGALPLCGATCGADTADRMSHIQWGRGPEGVVCAGKRGDNRAGMT